MERGAKFDAIVEQVFAMQLTGRGKTPEEREKILRKLSGSRSSQEKREEGREDCGKRSRSRAGKHTEASAAAAKRPPKRITGTPGRGKTGSKGCTAFARKVRRGSEEERRSEVDLAEGSHDLASIVGRDINVAPPVGNAESRRILPRKI